MSTDRKDIGAFSGRLAAFYLDCIEAEDRRALQLRTQDRGKSFVAPWSGTEPLLHPGADAERLAPTTASERAYLAKGAAGPSGPDTGYYGYPLRFDGRGRLAPLFVLPVSVEDLGDRGGAPVYRVHRTGDLLLNRYLLTGYTDEERDHIQAELEGDEFATFAARLKAALAYFDDSPFEDAASPQLEPFPSDTGVRWVRTPVFLRDARGPFTYNLRQELSALKRYDSVQAGTRGTALGVLMGEAATPGEGIDPAEIRPLNPSQEQAAEAALRQPLTVITGPPGTGKSQVVIDLLATAILEARPVLFASKNNQAIDVVRERLREALGEPYDFSLRLGNKEAMDALAPELLERLARLEETGPPGDDEEARAAVQGVKAKLARLDRLESDVREATVAERSAAEPVPELWRSATPADARPPLDLRTLRDLLEEARAYGGETPLGLVRWLRRLFRGSAVRRELTDGLDAALAAAPAEVRENVSLDVMQEDGYAPIIRALRLSIAYHGWLGARAEAQKAKEALRGALSRADTPEEERAALKTELADATTRLCRAVWARRLYDNADEARAALRAYQRAREGVSGKGAAFARSLDVFSAAQERLAACFPIWITTALSVKNALPLRPSLFDLVVIDEASQCDLASAVPLLYRARRAAVIGDPNQLRHIPGIDVKQEAGLASSSALLPAWSYVRHSLFDATARANRDAGRGEPLFLDEHYRSHPSIIAFSNRQFYGGQLKVRTDLGRLAQIVPTAQQGVFWHDVRGRVPQAARSAYNEPELDAVLEHVRLLLETLGAEATVGVVTPFRAQSDRIKRRIREAPWYDSFRERVGTGTAHTFQGDERDVIVFSPVVSEGMRDGTRRWAATTEALLNVAVTRARAGLHVVGDAEACRAAGGPLGALVSHAATT
ncbi:MAG: AAA domain-containing protein [Rhodothermales bacterium]